MHARAEARASAQLCNSCSDSPGHRVVVSSASGLVALRQKENLYLRIVADSDDHFTPWDLMVGLALLIVRYQGFGS